MNLGRGLLRAAVIVLVVAGCGTNSNLGNSSASGPAGNLQGTWALQFGPSIGAIPWHVLVIQKGDTLTVNNVDGSSFGEGTVDGMSVHLTPADTLDFGYIELQGSISADGRTVSGSAPSQGSSPSQGVASWRLDKVSNSFITSVTSDAFPTTGELRIPAGRSVSAGSSFAVTINGKPVDPALRSDGLGGSWTSIPLSSLPTGTDKVVVDYTQTAPLGPFAQGTEDTSPYLQKSQSVDWGDPAILAKSQELTKGLTNRLDKARAIHQFVITEITNTMFPGEVAASASQTLNLGAGMAANSSRLFVALARAAGIPARTVLGILNHDSLDTKIFDQTYEWAEFLDGSDRWHPVDFSLTGTFDLSDIGIFGLQYSAEENPLVRFANGPYSVGSDVAIVNSYPAPYVGRNGFRVVENEVDKMVVENVYTAEVQNGQVRFVLDVPPSS
jgi:hypothetical protein